MGWEEEKGRKGGHSERYLLRTKTMLTVPRVAHMSDSKLQLYEPGCWLHCIPSSCFNALFP